MKALRTLLLLIVALIATSPARAETAVRVTLDSRIEGPTAPLFAALDRGYFRNEQLTVTVEPGADSSEAIKRVAAGTSDIGTADINALIRFRDANPRGPKAIFIIYNRPPFAIVARKSRGIEQPKDLEGKRIGAPASADSTTLWPVFAKASGIDLSKVGVENIGIPVREPMLAAGQIDAIAVSVLTAFPNLKERGVPLSDLTVLRMAEHGVEAYGRTIIVNSKFAADQPEAVKAFLRAYLHGLRDTVKSPASAVEAVLKRNEDAKKAIELERLTMAIRDNIATSEVKENGYGEIDAARFARAMQQLLAAERIKSTPKLEDIFDASFLPDEKSRKF